VCSGLSIPAAYRTVSPTNPHWAGVVGYGPFSLWVIHKEGLCPSSGDINRLMMIVQWVVLSLKSDDFICFSAFLCIIVVTVYIFRQFFEWSSL
jgi:hypothetical protein